MLLTVRRIALPAAALLATAALAGCGGSSSAGSGSSSASGSGSGSGTAGQGLVAFIPGATGVGFYDALEGGAKAEAAKLGYSFLYQGSPDFTPPPRPPWSTRSAPSTPRSC